MRQERKLSIMKKAWLLSAMFVGGLALSGNASAIFIDFEQGATTGGSLTCADGNCVGSEIPFEVLKADTDGDGSADTFHAVEGILNFDTAANSIELFGNVPTLEIMGEVLLSGTFASWRTDSFGSDGLSFFGAGPDVKSTALMRALGIDVETEWDFGTFELAASNGGEVTSGDVLNVARVPEPMTLGLLGLGLVGMGVAARRRRSH